MKKYKAPSKYAKNPFSPDLSHLEPIILFVIADSHFRDGVSQPTDAGAGSPTSGWAYFTAQHKLRHLKNIIDSNPPDALLLLGDIAQHTTVGWSDFTHIWDTINCDKYIALGNHDFDDGTTYADLLTILGYQDKPENANSRFNQSITIEKTGIKIKILMCDFVYDSTGSRNNDVYIGQPPYELTKGRCPVDTMTWIETELNTDDATIILICSHHGIHGYNRYPSLDHFNEQDAIALNAMVQNATEKNLSLKRVLHLFGHAHSPTIDRQQYGVFDNPEPDIYFPGFSLPALVAQYGGASSNYVKVSIYPSGYSTFEEIPLQYPFP